MSVVRFKDVEKLDKKGLQQLGAQHGQALLDDGFHDATVLTVQARKAKEYIEAFIKQLDYETRAQITQDPEGWKDIYGCTLSISSTGDRLAYEQDSMYAHLKAKLQERKQLLDLAFKQSEEVYDSLGDQVPKVGIKTPSKETLKVNL